MTQFFTADLCDEYQEKIQVLAPDYHSYGGAQRFSGPIRTLRLHRNNSELIRLLQEPGEGAVAVVDVSAEYWAVVGENLMKLAQTNGWAGMIINGYVRDTQITKNIPVGLLALGTCPRKSFEENEAKRDIPLLFGGVSFQPGHRLFCDEDGVVLLPPSSL